MAPAGGQLIVNNNGQPGSTSGQVLVRPGNGGGAQVNCLVVQQNPNQGSSVMYAVTGHGAMTITPDLPSVSCATLNGSAAYTMTATTKALTANVATITVSGGTPKVDIGDTIVVALSPSDAVFDGTYTISAKSGNNLSYARTNTDVASTATGGTVSSTATATLQNINIGVPGAKGIIVKGAASQTANLQEWQDSSGTALASVSSSGNFQTSAINLLNGNYASGTTPALIIGADIGSTTTRTNATRKLGAVCGTHYTTTNASPLIFSFDSDSSYSRIGIGGGFSGYNAASQVWLYTAANTNTVSGTPRLKIDENGNVLVNGFTASTTGLTVMGAVSQTSNLQEWQAASSTVLAYVNASGGLGSNSLSSITVASGAGNNLALTSGSANGTGAGGNVTITAGNAAGTGAGGSLILQAGLQATSGGDGKVVVRQKSGQTSNLQEWQNSSSGILTSIGPSGSINLLPYGTSSGNTNEIRFNELAANGTDYVGFKAPDSISTPKIWTLPSGDGATGQALITNGSGLLSWGTIANLSSYTNTSAATTSAYDLGTSNFVKANPSASGLTINGFSSSGSYDGRMLKLVNVSNYNINIINTGTTVCVGGNNIVLGPKDGADLILDSGASVWRVF
jgi:hypothetical protein